MKNFKDAIKNGTRMVIEDENFRNKLLVYSAKQFLIGYGIGAVIVDIRNGVWSRK